MSSEVNFKSISDLSQKSVSHANNLKAEQMTSSTQILTAKQNEPLKDLKKPAVSRIIDGDDELKNILTRFIKHILLPQNNHPQYTVY